jgi:hypothetical protein
MQDKLKKAKRLLKAGKIQEAADLVKAITEELPVYIDKCPSCDTKAVILKTSKQDMAECNDCGAMWGTRRTKQNTHSSLLKYGYIEDQRMVKGNREVTSQLWSLYEQGIPGVEPFEINEYARTGWMAKSLFEIAQNKLGLPDPGEQPGEPLNKTELEEQAIFPGDLSKADILDAMLQMFHDGQESARINRHTITKFEQGFHPDPETMRIVLKKCGIDPWTLKKWQLEDQDKDVNSHDLVYNNTGNGDTVDDKGKLDQPHVAASLQKDDESKADKPLRHTVHHKGPSGKWVGGVHHDTHKDAQADAAARQARGLQVKTGTKRPTSLQKDLGGGLEVGGTLFSMSEKECDQKKSVMTTSLNQVKNGDKILVGTKNRVVNMNMSSNHI